ncbi:flagellin [Enterobacter hormaechei]|uniref:flagellin N-terminal helical domain-containing protein n=1 Tax=Enterobacter hormaechei TaxID=158836 RepID=UPI0020752B64|nr:flagellin [Enterobacter hormaechei]MCM7290870.1 flagellin FliC [Enterobacter hormaechei]MDO0900859.1 flagellin [Enterobacter hormaechei]MDO6167901.1 flagellin [Enterobacter hormaechei]MDO6172376.1 flagellin [Enterobacter hormaechei]MEB7374770.1 flagellin FliC [Enterobacter hormaechei]
MAQVINTNSLSLITQNNINKNQSALSSSIERLSSGLRINSAKDDAAGQAISNRFTSNIKGLTQAARNANDGISLAQTTEGALSEINNNLQRVRELTVQATTGTNSDSDLSSIQDEIKSRLEEIDRVSGQTQFNGVNVLAKDGTMKIQVGANDGQTISIDLKQIDSSTLNLSGFNVSKIPTITTAAVTTSTYADSATTIGAVDVSSLSDATSTVDLSTIKFDAENNKYYGTVSASTDTTLDGAYEITVASDGTASLAGGKLTGGIPATATKAVTKVQEATTAAVDTTTAAAALAAAGVTGADNTNVSLVKLTSTDSAGNTSDAGYGLKAADGKIYATNYDGTNAASFTAKSVTYTDAAGAPQTAAVSLGGIDGKSEVVTVGTGTAAKTYAKADLDGANLQTGKTSSGEALKETITSTTANPLKALDDAIATVDKFRSSLGAVQNRLSSAVTNLNNTTTNLSEAQSRIQDADYATEVSNMSKAQIIQQAGNSVLSKANQVPQQVLSLLQG